MNISRKAMLMLVVLGGLLAFSAGIGAISSNAFAEEDPDAEIIRKPVVVKREFGTIWTYQITCKEEAKAVVTKNIKPLTYTWETEKTSDTTIYFGDYDKKTDKWEILKSSRETSKLLKSYKTGDKDITASKAPFYRMFAAPRMYAGPANFMGKIEYAGPLDDRQWDEAVINHLPMMRKASFTSGEKGTGKVVVEGKEVGEYSYHVTSLYITTEMQGQVQDTYIRGTLQAKRADGRTITITNYASKWEGDRSVPMMVSWKMEITHTNKNSTEYLIKRSYELQTLGREVNAVVIGSLDATRMSAQLKAFRVGYDALMLSNLTATTLQGGGADRAKVLEAGKKYYEAYRQWPAGPFAEHILMWVENLNLLTKGSIMRAKIGGLAPPIMVKKWYNTKPIPPTAYEGKVVIVERFFPMCGPCRSAAPHVAKLYKTYGPKGLMVVGLTKLEYSAAQTDKPHSIESMIRNNGAIYPIAADAPSFVLFDKDGNLMKGPDRKYIKVERSTTNYPTGSYPHAFVIDRKGIVRWVGNPNDKRMDAMVIKLLNEK